ncbi:hypothetical protein J8J20_24875, partial [Mycobacterium tuberculosis]|nr:hypothetical protein [Mycobacterium tuberculosis]
VKISVYAISGYLAALAGILYVAQYRQGKPDAGMGLELDAIAAVVIGGTSAEFALKTAKYASAHYLDNLPTEGSMTAHAFRD